KFSRLSLSPMSLNRGRRLVVRQLFGAARPIRILLSLFPGDPRFLRFVPVARAIRRRPHADAGFLSLGECSLPLLQRRYKDSQCCSFGASRQLYIPLCAIVLRIRLFHLPCVFSFFVRATSTRFTSNLAAFAAVRAGRRERSRTVVSSVECEIHRHVRV